MAILDILICAREPPHFLKKRSENAGANENLSCRFPSIPRIAPGVAPRIVVFVLLKSVFLKIGVVPRLLIIDLWGHFSGGSKMSRAKKAHKHKETHRTPPNSDPTPKFFMWGPFSWKIKQKGPPIQRIQGYTGGPFILYVGFSLCAFFGFQKRHWVSKFRVWRGTGDCKKSIAEISRVWSPYP